MMQVSRRGLFGILAAGASAAIIRTPGLLMPIKPAKMLTLDDFARRVLNPAMETLAGHVTFPSNPMHGDTLTLNGQEFLFVRRDVSSSLWMGRVS